MVYEDVPKHLYRGVVIDYDDIDKFEFTGVDLAVNYEPIIDSNGRKTDLSGNEYGVYMSDNISMVKDVYGNLHNQGTELLAELSIANQKIKIPSVAVIYDIDTTGLNVRRPFISSVLSGHYNNGYEGDEWICDLVPKEKYSLIRVRIGADILHDCEDIRIDNPDNIKDIVKKKLEERKKRLEIFIDVIKKMPSFKRKFCSYEDIDIFKTIYGKNGVKYIKEDFLDTSNVDGMIKYLIAKTLKKDEDNIVFKTIKYINSLKYKVNNVENLVLEINKEEEKYISKKNEKKNDEKFNPDFYDDRISMLDELLLIAMKRLYDDKQLSFNDTIDENQENEVVRMWEAVKKRFDYNNLDDERKRIVENEYREMIYQKRMREIGVDSRLFLAEDSDERLRDDIEKVDEVRRLL